MKFNISLIAKITIVFIFTFVLIIFAFLTIEKMNKEKSLVNSSRYYGQLMDYLFVNRLDKNKSIKYLSTKNLSIVASPHKILNGAKDNEIIRKRGFEIIYFDDIYYLHIVTPHFRKLFQDNSSKTNNAYISYIVLIFILSLFLFIYILIIKNIKDTNLLLSSRQLFLRTVMHELKTPIAKGRIVSELIDNEKQKNRMSVIFDKLNFLINDFAKVEEIISKNFTMNQSTYSLNTILENAIQMLLFDEKDQEKHIEVKLSKDIKLNVDLDLIAMAIKNLLDNGIKYSTDKKVVIEQRDTHLLIISHGNKLDKPLEEYFKPFHNETKSKNHGMGLGLYIVYSILQIHKMKLEYTNSEDKNIFKIQFS